MDIKLEKLNTFVEDFLSKLEEKSNHDLAHVLKLEGNLGSGKTTFTKYLAKQLGIIEEEITSPTFVILKRYKTKNKNFKTLIHIDTYRLDSGDDLLKLGFEEILKEENTLIVVEWPERVSDILEKIPKENISHFKFIVVDEDTRDIEEIKSNA